MAADRQTVEQVLSKASLAADKVISIFTALLAALLLTYSGYVLYDNLYTQQQAYGSSWDVLKYRPDIIDDENAKLSASNMSEINQDYRAWLTIYSTNIDYPVMQGKDDLYYASHDVFKKSSLTGALYLSAANSPDFSDNYNLIYGHHMDVDALFGGLDSYRDKEYFDTHKNGIVVTPTAVYDATIFAVMQTSAYDETIYAPGNVELANLLSYVKSKSLIFDEKAASDSVKVLAMSTCESATTSGRLIVFAKLVKRNSVVPPDGVVPPGTDTPSSMDNYDPTITATLGSRPSLIDTVFGPVQEAFRPTGTSYGLEAWALVNLICLIITFFLLLPIGSIRAKFRRAQMMDRLNKEKCTLWYEDSLNDQEQAERNFIIAAAMEKYGHTNADEVTQREFEEAVESIYYEDDAFRRRFTICMVAETILALVALIVFILTEDMSLPMTLIDSWTPFMLLFLIATWVIDVRLARYRKPNPDDVAADANDLGGQAQAGQLGA